MASPLRALCAEPQNFSRAGLERMAALCQLDCAELTQQELAARSGDYDVLVVRLLRRVDAPMMASGRLKAVLSPTTGLDHLDLAAAEANNVALFHLRGDVDFLSGIHSTAEHSFALLLALIRKLPAAVESVRQGCWTPREFRGRELAGKTLGIAGCGRLGGKMATYGRAFGMQVLGFDIDPARAAAAGEVCASLDELMRRSWAVSVHMPLNDDTRNAIGATQLALMPPGGVLINTARGEIVDPQALLDALEGGRLSGAATDVLTDEREDGSMAAHPLVAYARTHDTLLITPHIGGACEEAIEKTDLRIIGRFADWLAGMERR